MNVLMTLQQYVVVPRYPGNDRTELERDCKVATSLLQKLMQDNSGLAPETAFQQLQHRISPICVFPWHEMKLLNSIESPSSTWVNESGVSP